MILSTNNISTIDYPTELSPKKTFYPSEGYIGQLEPAKAQKVER